MFEVLFFTIFSVFLMMLPGAALTKFKVISDSGLKDISKLLVFGIYPCLIFSSVTRNFTLREVFAAWALPTSSMLIMVVGYAAAMVAAAIFRFKSENKKNAFIFQNTINNYSFLPIAIIAEIFDSQAVAALIFSTLGAEVVVWTLGVFILNGHKFEKRSLKQLLSPPLLALYGSLIWLAVFEFTGVSTSVYTENNSLLYYPHNAATLIGNATIPVAMIVAGTRLAKIRPTHIAGLDIWLTVAMRLIVVPLLAAAALSLMPLGQWRAVMIVVAVMPVSILSSLMCEIYNSDRELINGTILITHLLSLLTIPLLLAILL